MTHGMRGAASLCCYCAFDPGPLRKASRRPQQGFRKGAWIAGHTWVLLATEIRRHSDKGPQHFRIHRPNNVTAADMQEGSLMQVCMLYVRKEIEKTTPFNEKSRLIPSCPGTRRRLGCFSPLYVTVAWWHRHLASLVL